ncbi:MAG: CD225/dispanin family protein [Nitriliruptoraceae bacterium]
MADSNPQPGWYEDPEQPGQLRWWDGKAWAEHRRPMPGERGDAPGTGDDPLPHPPDPPSSGAAAAGTAFGQPPVPPTGAAAGAPVKVDTWLWQSIVATVCCCLPLGIVGIVFAAQAQSAVSATNYTEAQEKARLAKIFSLVSYGLGVVFIGGWLLLMAAGTLAGF